MNFEFELHFCSINKGSPAVLAGKPLEQRRPVRRDRRARCVEHHPNERVVAHQADGIEDALVAELRDRAGIGGVVTLRFCSSSVQKSYSASEARRNKRPVGSIARHSLTSYVNFSDAESTNWPCARTKNQRRE